MEHKPVIGYYQIIIHQYINCTNHFFCRKKIWWTWKNQRFQLTALLRNRSLLFHLQGKWLREISLITNQTPMFNIDKRVQSKLYVPWWAMISKSVSICWLTKISNFLHCLRNRAISWLICKQCDTYSNIKQ